MPTSPLSSQDASQSQPSGIPSRPLPGPVPSPAAAGGRAATGDWVSPTAQRPGVPKRQSAELLVSVKNALEAELALQLGVDWIDLKCPDAGPLGAPTIETANAVAEVLGGYSRSSVALGELRDCDPATASELCEAFRIAKVGLAGEGDSGDWEKRLCDLGDRISPTTRLTPVIYADYPECAAPEPDQIFDVAAELQAEYLLVDTYTKDGRTLLDWLSLDELTQIIDRGREVRCSVVLAGSIDQSQLSTLLQLGSTAIAVRGAVCLENRQGAICPEKLEHWVRLFATNAGRTAGSDCNINA